MKFETEISTELLAAIARYASDDDSRPGVSQVVFRDDEIIATNGHMSTPDGLQLPKEVVRG